VMDAALVASYAQAEHQRHHHTPIRRIPN
jgi:hypothetical protein